MPPTSRSRRSPQRQDRRSRSRSRSLSKKSCHRGGQFRSRSRSRPQKPSRSPSRTKSHKFAKYQKSGSRSLSPPSHRHAARPKGGQSQKRGVKSPARKAPYRSQSGSRSHSPSPSTRPHSFSKGRKRTVVDSYYEDERQEGELSPLRQYTGKTQGNRGEASPSPPAYPRGRSVSPAVGGRLRDKCSDVDLRTQRYGVSSTTDHVPYAAASPGEQKKLLSDRFRREGVRAMEMEENITIGIHRKLSSRGPISNIVLREFDSNSDFVMLRHRDEGRKPLFSRSDIKSFHWDDKLDDEIFPVEEHRIITIAGSNAKSGTDPVSPVFTRTANPGSFVSRLGASPAQDMDYRPTTSSQLEISHRDAWMESSHDRPGTSRMDEFDWRGMERASPDYDDRRKFSKQRAPPQVRLDPRPDPHYEHVYRQHEYDEDKMEEDKLEKIQRNPDDLRHNLTKRHEQLTGGDLGTRDESSKFVSKGRLRSQKGHRGRSGDRDWSRSASRSHSRSRDRDGGKYQSRDAIKLELSSPRKKRGDMTWRERVDLANQGLSHFAPGKYGARGRGRGSRITGRPDTEENPRKSAKRDSQTTPRTKSSKQSQMITVQGYIHETTDVFLAKRTLTNYFNFFLQESETEYVNCISYYPGYLETLKDAEFNRSWVTMSKVKRITGDAKIYTLSYIADIALNGEGPFVYEKRPTVVTDLRDLDRHPDGGLVTIQCVVLNEDQKHLCTSMLQEKQIADNSGSTRLSCWGNFCEAIRLDQAYEIQDLTVKTHLGRKHLSTSPRVKVQPIAVFEVPYEHGHDNRERVDYGRLSPPTKTSRTGVNFRGRGRAGRVFRGSSFRGNYRGGSFRGNYQGTFSYRNRGGSFQTRGFKSTFTSRDRSRSPIHHGPWKHDLFDKLEKEDDQKPSSTTEK